MLLHITTNSSGYFENVWAWVADHDLDNQANAYAYENYAGVPLNILTDLSIYAGRGVTSTAGKLRIYAERAKLFALRTYYT